jgi:hypothetical protein
VSEAVGICFISAHFSVPQPPQFNTPSFSPWIPKFPFWGFPLPSCLCFNSFLTKYQSDLYYVMLKALDGFSLHLGKIWASEHACLLHCQPLFFPSVRSSGIYFPFISPGSHFIPPGFFVYCQPSSLNYTFHDRGTSLLPCYSFSITNHSVWHCIGS